MIVVGIIHNNRNKDVGPKMDYQKTDNENVLTETSNQFKEYLFSELVPFIDEKYSTSGYNVIVGHSNSGHFVLNLPIFKENPFDGIIALSVNGENENYSQLVNNYLKTTKNQVFIGYGVLDNGFNELAKSIENQIIKEEFSNENLKVNSFIASHNQLPILAAAPALKFMFKNYKNHSSFIQESKNQGFTVTNYLSDYKNVHKQYGIDLEISRSDLFALAELSVLSKDLNLFRQVLEYSTNSNDKIEKHYIFWLSTELKDYETADYIIDNLIKSKIEDDVNLTFSNFKAYSNYLLNVKKTPKKALQLARNMFENTSDYKLEFAYHYAKIAYENNLNIKEAKMYLEFCKKNFKENYIFNKSDLNDIKMKK